MTRDALIDVQNWSLGKGAGKLRKLAELGAGARHKHAEQKQNVRIRHCSCVMVFFQLCSQHNIQGMHVTSSESVSDPSFTLSTGFSTYTTFAITSLNHLLEVKTVAS